jgi:hypothetical protein
VGICFSTTFPVSQYPGSASSLVYRTLLVAGSPPETSDLLAICPRLLRGPNHPIAYSRRGFAVLVDLKAA